MVVSFTACGRLYPNPDFLVVELGNNPSINTPVKDMMVCATAIWTFRDEIGINWVLILQYDFLAAACTH